jgi:DNA-binding XRE family transcriptional regulator
MTADKYRAARERLGLTQERLAARLGVTRATINAREAGRVPITPESALAILALPLPLIDPDVAVAKARRGEKSISFSAAMRRLKE